MISKIEVSIATKSGTSYPIWIGVSLLKKIAPILPKNISTLVIITDSFVKKQYALNLLKHLRTLGYKVLLLSFPFGEKSKNNRSKVRIETRMLVNGCDRDSVILALGGGVVGDMAGFIAATYMRGIAYIQIPTTFLAMLDSSVGGKTGINTPQGKNLIGAFWQPTAVIADINCLKTLPKEEMINGLIEAIKMFLTSDLRSFNYLKQNLELILKNDAETLQNIVDRAVTIKADIISKDERENSQRVILNFGHTIGHALEQLTAYQMKHGYAVAYGLLVEVKIAQMLGLLEPTHYLVIKMLLSRLNIVSIDLKTFNINEIIQSTYGDKKNHAGCVYYVLLNDLGKVYVDQQKFAHPVADEVVKNAFLEVIKD